MEMVDLLIHSAGQVCVVPAIDGGPQRGAALGTLGVIADGAVAISDGRIVAVGTTADVRSRYSALSELDAGGRCVVPGFVDPHTHIPWAGERAAEFEMRVGGATYMELMAAGGGINATVRAVRAATVEQLVAENRPRLDAMLNQGTTSAECKTGYGLDLETELKQLNALAELAFQHPIDITPTFMPAHAIPDEFRGRTDDFVRYVCADVLPAGAAWMQERGLVLFCDVFCETGVFDVAQSRQILEAAKALGYRLKIHADEFDGLGGTKMAVELGATSADHLVATPDEDIAALGAGGTVAVALPGTPFGLGSTHFTPAKQIIAAGGALAIATDYNPGSAPGDSMQLSMAIAGRYLGLTPAQALAASTINSACAIARGDEVGSLEPGKQADVLVLRVNDYRYLGYHYGSNLVHTVIKRGEVLVGV